MRILFVITAALGAVLMIAACTAAVGAGAPVGGGSVGDRQKLLGGADIDPAGILRLTAGGGHLITAQSTLSAGSDVAGNGVGFFDFGVAILGSEVLVTTVPGGAAEPTDTNGDGLYEDINGNGRKDFADIVLYFNQMSWISTNEPESRFDYSGNGRIDFADVVWLFNHIEMTYTEPELKYLLLDHYSEDRFFYCDPDYYPISRGDELERALEAFPAIQNDTAEFAAITARTGLVPPYSADAKLVIYREHKRLQAIPLVPATADSYTYTMRLGTEGQGLRVTGTVGADGAIRETSSVTAFLTCPICLAAGTRIDTPVGQVPVGEVREGTIVWTWDTKGERVAAPVLRTARTRAPPNHVVVQVELSDGRTVTASPGHPTVDGSSLGRVRTGDVLDGAVVLSAETVPYDAEFVYDLLPAGATGWYRADGVLLGSTLH